MKLKLVRKLLNEHFTIGELYIDDKFECFTMEDKDRQLEAGGIKIPAYTAVPLGTYRVIVNMSNRFRKLMPLLISVPGFEGVRIHPGNTAKDTEGCILVGQVPGPLDKAVAVVNSRVTYEALFKRIREAYDNKDKITLTIERG